MEQNASICIIGGGAAGLAAAVFLARKGFKIKLIESSPKFGGRAYSFFDNTIDTQIDNGQHILAAWYKDTFEFLKIIGSYNKLSFQKSLNVEFANLDGNEYSLNCPNINAPMNLLLGLMRYKAIGFKDRMAVIKLIRTLKSPAISDETLKKIGTKELFEMVPQPQRLVNAFWKPFIVAVFNAGIEDTSAYMFAKMIRLGFVQKGNSGLVLPNDFLSDLYVTPALKYLGEKGSETISSVTVKKLNFEGSKIVSAELSNGESVQADYYISAVPWFDFEKLIGTEIFEEHFSNVKNLRSSPILNVHIKFDSSISSIMKDKFLGIIEGTIQWIFKVQDDQVCIVISHAGKIANKDKTEIIEICKAELYRSLPRFKEIGIKGVRVLKEMRATFIPDNQSLDCRPEQKTNFTNFYIAGDWTNTGLPATIEGAVRSGKICTEEIMQSLNNN